MGLLIKSERCAACGSTAVSVKENKYHCSRCGQVLDFPMNQGDMACINRIALHGGSSEELQELRRKYPHLDLATWSSENRVQI